MIDWVAVSPAVLAAFLASLVEVVEAFTIVLAVGTVQGWRPALTGAGAALIVLAVVVAIFGPVLEAIPIHILQLVIGILLLLFGLRWLRKAVLRAAGRVALHDEDKIYARQAAELRDAALRRAQRLDWLAGLASFKAVLLEGTEVVFIVIAVGAGRGLIVPASLGALAAVVLVAIIGLFVHRPLARVPENTLKYVVGLMLTSYGIFWTGGGPRCRLARYRSRARRLRAALSCNRPGPHGLAAPPGGSGAVNALRQIAAELIGLFLDDAFLAVATLAVVALAALASALLHLPLLAGIILVAGCVGALVLSAVRTK